MQPGRAKTHQYALEKETSFLTSADSIHARLWPQTYAATNHSLVSTRSPSSFHSHVEKMARRPWLISLGRSGITGWIPDPDLPIR